MRILVTGNLGYIGKEVTKLLSAAGHAVIGVDTDFYRNADFFPAPDRVETQLIKDIRKLEAEDFEGIDCVVHLAALSNDPLGEIAPEITYDINHKASVRIAELAKNAGVSRFVMTSTASVYGIADEKVHENSKLNPITAYAKSKLMAENDIMQLKDDSFSPTFLRPATAYGIGSRLRTDIVLNNLCGWAHTARTIKIMSDGTPLRPAVHVRDIAKTICACVEADREKVHGEIFNVGKNDDNYSIRQMAEAVKAKLPDCDLTFTGEHSDSRSYHILFDKLHKTFGDALTMDMNLEKGVLELTSGYQEHALSAEDFEGGKYTRLAQIKKHLNAGALDEELFWK